MVFLIKKTDSLSGKDRLSENRRKYEKEGSSNSKEVYSVVSSSTGSETVASSSGSKALWVSGSVAAAADAAITAERKMAENLFRIGLLIMFNAPLYELFSLMVIV